MDRQDSSFLTAWPLIDQIAASRFVYYIHINDNNGKWDWDYMVGTHHLLDYREFLYYLRKYDYDDFMTSDTSPTRWDIKGTFEMNVRLSNKLWALLEQKNSDDRRRRLSKNLAVDRRELSVALTQVTIPP